MRSFIIGCVALCTGFVQAQTQQTVINHNTQTWVSINTNATVAKHWSITLDLHERRTNGWKDANFHFVRTGANYLINDQLSVGAGYAHLWLATAVPGTTLYANENRLYQQVQLINRFQKVILLQKIRNEQRWQQKIVNNKATDANKFSNRIRYLLSVNVLVSKNVHLPSLVLSNELCVQFGKEIVYNSFDQNRLFIGIKQRISRQLSFDAGYMLVTQQKASGYQYDINDTFRCFFYYSPNLFKKKN